ncbi:pathogen-associated molecular patterns-induced protein A70-like [Actinidia eriantha]|uniref:pathogen-associated molecular patterns-induced protein A70-like n=1 Tax=Actinidia eriantha TaxID=165200 RepID=UPI00258F1325|nr:pathogen-associated molecular patterns-induced protein A70-like [Actinidia eriantha]
MFDDSVSAIPSIWASMNSWFTPTVLFVLLNVMILTIAFTSSLANQEHPKNPQPQDDPQHQNHLTRLAKSPSVLQHLRSINLYSYTRSQDPPITTQNNPIQDSDAHFAPEQTHQHQIAETETQIVLQRTQFEEEQNEDSMTLDEVYSQLKGRHVRRVNSDTKPVAGEFPEWLPAKMRKSASAKSAFAHFKEEDVVEARRPATVREGNARATEADEEVDAKADDFINRFKHQLKLQKLDSIVRNKEMVTRGAGNMKG